MSLLVLGLVLFLGVHSVRIFADTWRRHTISRMGLGAWKAAYSLVSIAGFVLIVFGWSAARSAPEVLWIAPLWMKHAASLFTLVAFVLLAAAYVPGNAIKAAVGHPMVAGVKLWAFVHLLVNGTVADVVLFGGFLAWAVADRIAVGKRATVRRTPGAPASRFNDVIAVVLGLVLYFVFVRWGHAALFGVAPFLPR